MQHTLKMPNVVWQGTLRSSRYYTILLLGLHLGSLAIVYVLAVGLTPQWILGALIVASGIYSWQRNGTFARQQLMLSQQHGIALIKPDGVQRSGELVRGGFNSPWIVILAVQIQDAPYKTYMVIFRDALDEEAFRQLRVYLRFVE